MFTNRELFIISLFDKLQQDVADTCESMLSDDKNEAQSSLKNLFISIEHLRSLTIEDDEE